MTSQFQKTLDDELVLLFVGKRRDRFSSTSHCCTGSPVLVINFFLLFWSVIKLERSLPAVVKTRFCFQDLFSLPTYRWTIHLWLTSDLCCQRSNLSRKGGDKNHRPQRTNHAGGICELFNALSAKDKRSLKIPKVWSICPTKCETLR